jgi:hypothetical protein
MRDSDDPRDPHERISSVKAITEALEEASINAPDDLVREIVRQRRGLHVTPGLIASVRQIIQQGEPPQAMG